MELLDKLIEETVKIAIDKGIIESRTIIIDATHTKSRYNSKTPRQALQEQSKKLRRTIYEVDETMKEKFPDKNTEDSLEKEIERDLKKKELCEANGIIIKYCVRKSVIKKYDIFNNKIYKNIYNQNNIIYA